MVTCVAPEHWSRPRALLSAGYQRRQRSDGGVEWWVVSTQCEWWWCWSLIIVGVDTGLTLSPITWIQVIHNTSCYGESLSPHRVGSDAKSIHEASSLSVSNSHIPFLALLRYETEKWCDDFFDLSVVTRDIRHLCSCSLEFRQEKRRQLELSRYKQQIRGGH